MPVLPIPMIIALLLAGFLVLRLVQRETHATLLALIGICALQSALNALVQYYGFSALRPLQPVLAMVIPPVAWMAFSRAAGNSTGSSRQWWHAAGPLSALCALVLQPMLLDLLIPLSFVVHGVAMLLALWRGEDSLLHSRLEGGSSSVLAWRVVAASLLASAACDVLIAYNLANGESGLLLWLPSIMSSLTLLGLGALGLSHAIESRRDDAADDAPRTAEDTERDQATIAKLDAFVVQHKPHLDPDLTLARLARKLLLPAKQLSTAINRLKGENVSRYVNRLRIEHACQSLAAGQNVTTAMLESGFNTKSNFNREFQRINKMSPREWLQNRAGHLQNVG